MLGASFNSMRNVLTGQCLGLSWSPSASFPFPYEAAQLPEIFLFLLATCARFSLTVREPLVLGLLLIPNDQSITERMQGR